MKFQPIEHVAFDSDNHEHHAAIGTTDFDFEAVDEALGFIRKARPTARQEAAELFRELASWCFSGNRSLRTALVKFIAIVSGLRPELLADRNGRSLATELHVTKQALSHQSARFSDAFGIKFARCRSKEAREHMRKARIGGPNRNVKHDEIKTTHPSS